MTTRIAITGASGLLGWHLRCFLHGEAEFESAPCFRGDFKDPEGLAATFAGVQAVAHLAGMNRGEEAEVERSNIALAEQLVVALECKGSRPHLIYASTTHTARDTPYGRSKRLAGEVLRSWAERVRAKYTCLTLPHVFGEGGRPFYNSVVSTFCHQLATQVSPSVRDDGELELVHAQDVAKLIADVVREGRAGELRVRGAPLRVTQLRDRLSALAQAYRAQMVPELRDTLDLQLFNTYRSYLMPSGYPVAVDVKSDPRGILFEAVRSLNGGQCFMSATRPGFTRGNHYHRHKVERFFVVGGDAKIRVRRLFDSQVHEFLVSGGRPAYVDMPTFNTHCITNIGSRDLTTLFWSHEIYDPARPDTYPEKVDA